MAKHYDDLWQDTQEMVDDKDDEPGMLERMTQWDIILGASLLDAIEDEKEHERMQRMFDEVEEYPFLTLMQGRNYEREHPKWLMDRFRRFALLLQRWCRDEGKRTTVVHTMWMPKLTRKLLNVLKPTFAGHETALKVGSRLVSLWGVCM